ncbi:Hypothetical protein ACI5QL_03373 [Bacillus velezensis]
MMCIREERKKKSGEDNMFKHILFWSFAFLLIIGTIELVHAMNM